MWVSLTLLGLCCVRQTFAQETMPQWESKPKGNFFSRILKDDYKTPPVSDFHTRREDLFDAMVKDGKMMLSVEDAVRLALENNVDINVERYSPYFSFWGIEKSHAVLDPSLNYSTTVNRNVVPTSSVLAGGATLFNLDIPYSVSVRKPFEPGLDLGVSFSTLRNRTSNTFVDLNPSFTSVIGVSLTQHLLKDFGKISRGRFLRIARNDYSISQATFVQNISDIITNVLNAYWTLVFTVEDIKDKEASLKLAQVVLDQNKIQAQVGTMAPLDVIQAEADVATRTEQVVSARYAKRIAENLLKKLISSREDPNELPVTIETTSPPEPPAPPTLSMAEAIRHAYERRPELQQQQIDQDNKKIQVQYAKNQLLPSLDIAAAYVQNGLGGDNIVRDYSNGFFNAPIIGIIPGGFWDSLDSMFSRRYLGYTLGVTFTIPIGNSDARASYAQARIDYKQSEERYRSLRQQVALGVREAYEAYNMSKALVDTAQVTVLYQEKKVQGEQDKYSLGATTTRFLLEAQRDLQDAQSRLLNAKINLIKARIVIDHVTGDMLTANRIELKDALPGMR